jgi:uncharacterized membrane protein
MSIYSRNQLIFYDNKSLFYITLNKLFFLFSQLIFIIVLLGISSPTLSKLSNAYRNKKEKESTDTS